MGKRTAAGTSRGRETSTIAKVAAPIVTLRTHVLVALGLLAILVLVHWRILIANGSAQGWLWEDALEYFYPVHSLAASWISRGALPLWDPYTFAGMPHLGDVGTGLLYPPNFLLALFVDQGVLSYRAFEWFTVLHSWLAGFGMWLLAWYLTRSLGGSLLAALAFMLSGFMSTHVIHLSIVQTAAWLPFIFWFALRAVEERRARHAVVAGLFLGVASLAGHPQTSLLLTGAAMFPALMEAVFPPSATSESGAQLSWWRRRGIPLVYPLLAGVVAVGIAAPQLIATRELLGLTIRQEMNYAAAAEGSFGPASFLTLLLPNYFGDVHRREWADYWGPGSYFYGWELAAYTGIAALFLALFALRGEADRADRRRVILIGALALAGLLLAMGRYGLIHWLLYEALPPFRRLRIPARAVLVFDFGIALLAAYGFRSLIERGGALDRRRITRWIRIAGVIVGVAAIAAAVHVLTRPPDWKGYMGGDPRPAATAAVIHLGVVGALLLGTLHLVSRGRLGAKHAGVALIAITAFDLLRVGWDYSAGRQSPEQFFHGGREQIIRAFQEEGRREYFRVNGRPEENPEALVLRRNSGPILGVYTIEGYNQLKLSAFQNFKVASDLRLNLLNVKYKSEVRDGSLQLIRNPGQFPRAFLVPGAREASSESEALALMNDPGFDPAATVILLPDGDHAADAASDGGVASGNIGTATIRRFEANRIEMDAEVSLPAWLVLSEIYYPAWRARVDGAPAPLRRADYCLRAVPVPAGRHTVEVFMSDAPLRKGFLMGALALAAALALVFIDERRRGR